MAGVVRLPAAEGRLEGLKDVEPGLRVPTPCCHSSPSIRCSETASDEMNSAMSIGSPTTTLPKAARPVLWKGGRGRQEAEGRGASCGAKEPWPGASSGAVGPTLPVVFSQLGSAAPRTSRSDPLLGSTSSSSRNCSHKGGDRKGQKGGLGHGSLGQPAKGKCYSHFHASSSDNEHVACIHASSLGDRKGQKGGLLGHQRTSPRPASIRNRLLTYAEQDQQSGAWLLARHRETECTPGGQEAHGTGWANPPTDTHRGMHTCIMPWWLSPAAAADAVPAASRSGTAAPPPLPPSPQRSARATCRRWSRWCG